MASRAINMYGPLTRPCVRGPLSDQHAKTARFSRWTVACSAAAQESSSSSPTATVTDRKESGPAAAAEVVAPAAAAPPKAKPKKAPVKALPDLMEEDVIPSLKATLEAEEDLSQIELSFQDNRLEGSFLKNDIPYAFWAFFPDGTLNGTKGFALSSYGSEASTVEPFLIDEKKITARLVVFWIEKRLAAQGIIPVWKEE